LTRRLALERRVFIERHVGNEREEVSRRHFLGLGDVLVDHPVE
jgi:hypothetical protein